MWEFVIRRKINIDAESTILVFIFPSNKRQLSPNDIQLCIADRQFARLKKNITGRNETVFTTIQIVAKNEQQL